MLDIVDMSRFGNEARLSDVVCNFPRVAAELSVMDFEVGHGSADLTAPAVSPKSGPLWICNFSHRLQVLQAGVCHPLRGEN